MAMRAIHIEIAYDLTFNSFMHIFRQFGSRRGYPEEKYSDNGTNFRKAAKEFHKLFDEWQKSEIIKFCTMNNCRWYFNPPISPHMGGAWERLVGSIKRHLNNILTDRFPQEYVLRTLLCEIEFIINNRPLSFNSNDVDEFEPLTPNDWLIGPTVNNFPVINRDNKNLSLLSMWRSSRSWQIIFGGVG